MASRTAIKKCICKHEFQDATYGVGMRVYNKAGANDRNKWRCTVCGRDSDGGTVEAPKAEAPKKK
jgi:hypothetical protein